MRDYYRVDSQRAIGLLQKLKIVHPYGTIGAFSVDLNTGHSNYGMHLQGVELIERAKTIRTIYESTEDRAKIASIRTEIDQADQLIFLGFGFHQLNLDLLSPDEACRPVKVIATAKGVSSPSFGIFESRIRNMLSGRDNLPASSDPEVTIELVSGSSCAEVLTAFRHVLSR